jgi:hypothetical protein
MSGAGGEVQRSARSRHLVVRLAGGDPLPASLIDRLRDEGVSSGWLRASGVLADAEIRTLDPRGGGLGAPRVLAGVAHAICIEGAIGVTSGTLGCSLRGVIAREGDAGAELLAGEIQAARAVGLEVLVTSFDDLVLERAFDTSCGVWLVAPPAERPLAAAAPGGWSSAVAASDYAAPSRSVPGAPAGPRMPQRPVRQTIDLDAPTPQAGDLVEHFAFGRCEVIKSDGDRLHLRVPKDARIKEIALEKLRVTLLGDEPHQGDSPPRRRFKLDRKI